MQDIFASARAAIYFASCAGLLLIASSNHASSQLLDPGWQLVYTGQPSFGGGAAGGGSGGVIESLFGAGAGQSAVQRPDQPAPVYEQQAQLQQPGAYPSGPVYYQQVPPPQPGAYRTGPVYYQQVPPPQLGGPVYYQQVPPPQPGAYRTGPVYYQQVPPPQPHAAQPAPASFQSAPPPPQQGAFQPLFQIFQSAPAPQPSAYQPAPASNRSATPQPGAVQPSLPSYQLAAAPQASAAQPAPPSYQSAPAPQQGPFEPLFQLFRSAPAPQPRATLNDPAPSYAPSGQGDMAHPMVDPKYDRQLVDYHGDEQPGTIVIDTPHYFLYLVEGGGKALRYGIGVGRPGFTWAGVKEISAKREWPDWYPPAEMLERRPDLPRYMPGGPSNPLGARALYLGSTLYRIHGSNEPWTIGAQVSSGCIRLRNEDVIDLYERVKVGTKVVVI